MLETFPLAPLIADVVKTRRRGGHELSANRSDRPMRDEFMLSSLFWIMRRA
jgi:hypothetical protein